MSCSTIQKESKRELASNDEVYGYIYFVNQNKKEVAQIISYSSDRPSGDEGNEFTKKQFRFLQVETLLNDEDKRNLVVGKNQYLYKLNTSEKVELTHCYKRNPADRSYCRFPRMNTSLRNGDLSYLEFQNKRYMKYPYFVEKGYIIRMDKLTKSQKKLLKKVSKELFTSPSGKGLKIRFKGEILKDPNYDVILKYIKFIYDGYPFRFYR